MERPIFQTATMRQGSAELKRQVIERDGLAKGCYWCKEQFGSGDVITLEHIIPLADGGPHELSNCALAHEECNLKNIPKCVAAAKTWAEEQREEKARANRLANGGKAEHEKPKDCSQWLVACFDAVDRHTNGRPLKYNEASFILKKLHEQRGHLPPSKEQRYIFKGHFNRWLTEKSQRIKAK